MPLAEHYGQRAERFRAAAQGFVDDRLRVVFPRMTGNSAVPARDLLRKHHKNLLERLVRWSALDEKDADAILLKLEDRAGALRSEASAPRRGRKAVGRGGDGDRAGRGIRLLRPADGLNARRPPPDSPAGFRVCLP